MKNSRKNIFDKNRRMDLNEQARNIIEQQEAQIRALQARVEELTQPAVAQQNSFSLTSEQFLNHITKLRSFNGKDEYTVQEFITTVERTLLLCQDIPGLRNYATVTIINEKIQGEAKRCIQRLHTNARWEDVVAELKQHFKPRHDYAELLNQCRSLKVSSLRELFYCIKEINYKLNELYDFDEKKPPTYHPSNNDKYLMDIISSKVHDFLRDTIPENGTIIQAYNKFDKLKLLDNEDAIDFRSRRNKVNSYKNSFVHNKTNNKNSYDKNNYYNNNKSDRNNSDNNKNNFNRNISNFNSNYRNNYNRNDNNASGLQRNNYNNFNRNYNHNYSVQYRRENQNSYQQPRQNSGQVRNYPIQEPMEISSLNQGQDVNFHYQPRNPKSPL